MCVLRGCSRMCWLFIVLGGGPGGRRASRCLFALYDYERLWCCLDELVATSARGDLARAMRVSAVGRHGLARKMLIQTFRAA